MSLINIEIKYPRGTTDSRKRTLTKKLVTNIRRYCPRRTGKLQRSIRSSGLERIIINRIYASYADGYTRFVSRAINATTSRFYNITWIKIGYSRYRILIERKFI